MWAKNQLIRISLDKKINKIGKFVSGQLNNTLIN